MTDAERQVMGIIASSGESKAKAFEAMRCIRTSDYDRARELLKESHEADVEAHNIQTELIQQDLAEDKENTPISLLMVHAQDQYMTSQMARDLIEEMIKIFEEKEGKTK